MLARARLAHSSAPKAAPNQDRRSTVFQPERRSVGAAGRQHDTIRVIPAGRLPHLYGPKMGFACSHTTALPGTSRFHKPASFPVRAFGYSQKSSKGKAYNETEERG